MKISTIAIVLSFVIIFESCIGDDFVNDTRESELSITNPIDTLGFETAYQFESRHLNNIGQEMEINTLWTSADESIIQIEPNGLAFGVSEGSTIIYAEALDEENVLLMDSLEVAVGAMTTEVENDSIAGSIATTTFYVLEGDFVYSETSTGVNLRFEDNYVASSSLPGLYVYLSNNKNSVASALEIGSVDVFEGAHEYNIPGVSLTDYQFLVYFCKPFNVKVGDGTF